MCWFSWQLQGVFGGRRAAGEGVGRWARVGMGQHGRKVGVVARLRDIKAEAEAFARQASKQQQQQQGGK